MHFVAHHDMHIREAHYFSETAFIGDNSTSSDTYVYIYEQTVIPATTGVILDLLVMIEMFN